MQAYTQLLGTNKKIRKPLSVAIRLYRKKGQKKKGGEKGGKKTAHLFEKRKKWAG